MIYLNRCVDNEGYALWVAGNLDEEKRRVSQLYCGLDVNGAIKAVVDAGMSRETAVAEAKRILARKLDEIKDDIAPF